MQSRHTDSKFLPKMEYRFWPDASNTLTLRLPPKQLFRASLVMSELQTLKAANWASAGMPQLQNWVTAISSKDTKVHFYSENQSFYFSTVLFCAGQTLTRLTEYDFMIIRVVSQRFKKKNNRHVLFCLINFVCFDFMVWYGSFQDIIFAGPISYGIFLPFPIFCLTETLSFRYFVLRIK